MPALQPAGEPLAHALIGPAKRSSRSSFAGGLASSERRCGFLGGACIGAVVGAVLWALLGFVLLGL